MLFVTERIYLFAQAVTHQTAAPRVACCAVLGVQLSAGRTRARHEAVGARAADVRAAAVVVAAGRGADAALAPRGHGLEVLDLVHHGLHRHALAPRPLGGALQRALAEVRPEDVVAQLQAHTEASRRRQLPRRVLHKRGETKESFTQEN